MWSESKAFSCRTVVASLLAGVAALLFSAAADAQEARTGGPYVPTPQAVVDEMLKVANVTQKDFVIDLGSGDGRIVLTAARRYRAAGMGVDIDEELVTQSNAEARRDNLHNLAMFRKADVLETSIREATVVTLYLLPEMMRILQSRMLFDLKPGTRVVSHDFDFGDWQPDRKVKVELTEKYNVTGSFESNVFLWVVPARVQGRWRMTLGGGRGPVYPLEFKQEYQAFEGAMQAGGRTLKFAGGKLDGARLSFRVPGSTGVSGEYRGTVTGEVIRGEAVVGGATVPWSAARIAAAP